MDKEKLEKLGADWKVLDNKYDGYIQELIDSLEPALLTSDKLETLKKLQEELFSLETELFRVLQGE
jgi:hypothetical protein